MSIDDFEEKYIGVDLKHLEASKVESISECLWLMTELDSAVADIEFQIQALSPSPYIATRNTIKLAKARRAKKGARHKKNSLQLRMRELKEEKRDKRRKAMEDNFIDAAMLVLPKETIQKIWDAVHRND